MLIVCKPPPPSHWMSADSNGDPDHLASSRSLRIFPPNNSFFPLSRYGREIPTSRETPSESDLLVSMISLWERDTSYSRLNNPGDRNSVKKQLLAGVPRSWEASQKLELVDVWVETPERELPQFSMWAEVQSTCNGRYDEEILFPFPPRGTDIAKKW